MAWVYVPSVCSQGLRASTSESSSPVLTCERFATSSETGSASESFRHEWPMAALTTRRSGTTLPRSTEPNGAAESTLSPRAIPASLGASQGSDEEPTMSAGSGRTWRVSLARFDRDSRSWRMSQATLFGTGWGPCLPTLPRSGSMRSGELSERPTLERPISDDGYSFWPTLTSNDDNKSPEAHLAMKRRLHGNKEKADGSEYAVTSLQVAVQLWSTPTVNDSKNDAAPSVMARHTEALNVQAVLWSTPTVTDANGRGYCYSRGDHDKKVLTLTGQASLFSLPDPTNSRSGQPFSGNSPNSRRRLNALFVAWLMGLPIGRVNPVLSAVSSWPPLVTPSCRNKPLSPSQSSGDECKKE